MEQARRDSATEKRSKTLRRISAAQSAAQCDAKLRRESDGVAQNLNAAARRNHRRTETRCAKPRHNSAVQQHDEPATEKRGAEARRNSATQQCDGKAAQQRGMRSTSGL